MLSLITRFSQSIGFLRLLEKRADFAQHQLKRDGDERNNAQDSERQPPVDGKQQHARADDQEKRRNDRGDGQRHKHLHRIHIGREIRQEFGRRDLFHPSERLHGDLRRQARPQILRHALGGPDLYAALRVGKNKHEESHHHELDNHGAENETALRVRIDGVGDQLRHHQVQGVADDGQCGQRGDQQPIRLEKRHKPRGGRTLSSGFLHALAHGIPIAGLVQRLHCLQITAQDTILPHGAAVLQIGSMFIPRHRLPQNVRPL